MLYEEAARVKADLDIRRVKVSELLANTVNLVTPDAGLFGADLPLPAAAAPIAARPLELIQSDEGAPDDLARAAQEPAPYESSDSKLRHYQLTRSTP